MFAAIGLALLAVGFVIVKAWGDELGGLGADWMGPADWIGSFMIFIGGGLCLASACIWLWNHAP